jgi:phospholipase C
VEPPDCRIFGTWSSFIQENRSFDNYFGLLSSYREAKGLPNDVDGLDVALKLKTYSGKTVTPFHQRTVETDVMSPSWNESHFYVDRQDNGEFKLDNWMMQKQCSILVATDPECTRTMGYYDQTDIPYYYELATQFATSDRFHSSAMSGTIVNRSYLLSATSGGMNNPDDPFPVNAPTIFRRLSEAGISWKYFYQDDSVFLGYYVCGGACDWDMYKNNVVPIDKYYEILSRSTADQDLPQVVFIEHAAKLRLDEHTGNNIQLGVADAKKIIDSLIHSSAWPSSVFFLSHDEGGGMYDHVAPYPVSNPDGKPPLLGSADIGRWDNFTYSGFRVPLLVVSPWVKPHYVSHTNREFTSILKFIETRYGLAPLTNRDAEADDMLEFFDFSAPAWLTPPALPDQPTNGVVDRSLQKYPG